MRLEEINFGKVSGEAEVIIDGGSFTRSNYQDVFNLEKKIKNGHFIVCGRKGTGKTINMEFIKLNRHANKKTTLLDFEKFKLAKLLSGVDINEENCYQFWKWIFLIKLLEIVSEVDVIKENSRISQSLEKILNQVQGFIDITSAKHKKVSDEYHGTLKSAQFNKLASLVLGVKRFVETEDAHFLELVSPLEKMLKVIIKDLIPNYSEKDWYVFLDKIDENYSALEPEKLVVSNCLKAARDLFLDLGGHEHSISFYPVILIREDIFEQLGENLDLRKFKRDHTVFLHWHDFLDESESKNLLKVMIENRISYSFERMKNEKGKSWDDIFYGPDWTKQNKTSFKYILDKTLFRPRDMISIFLSIQQKYPEREKIDKKMVDRSLKSFYSELLDELRFEMKVQFPDDEIAKIVRSLKKLSQNKIFHCSDFAHYMNESNIEYVFSIIRYLYKIGCICVVVEKETKDHYYWSYRDKNSVVDVEDFCEESIFQSHVVFSHGSELV